MKEPSFPEIPKSLMDELELRFPDRMPHSSHDVETIRIKQGEVNVVRFLKHQFELQTKTILEKK